MSTTLRTPVSASSSLASSATFRTFATVFAIATPVLYVICDMQNWPLFTYHPGTDRIDLGWAPAVKDEGPAMYWYGWTASTLIGAAVLGGLATLLPAGITRRVPLALVWIMPLLVLPVLVYSLKFFWRW
jgi:RsiW-degrading membrane proteinase PrsW (M82 family)